MARPWPAPRQGRVGRWAGVDVLSYASTAPGAGNQEAKICADAILRLLAGSAPDPQPVANSACFSPITATESASINGDNFQRLGIWFDTLMRDTSG